MKLRELKDMRWVLVANSRQQTREEVGKSERQKEGLMRDMER